MPSDQSHESSELSRADILDAAYQAERQKWAAKDESVGGPWSYQMRLGRRTIWLDTIEYRILIFLAAQPYHAFTEQRIADGVSTQSHPVTVETLGDHIASLRDKLGPFSDYVQSVPYIGYRFKA